MKHTKEVTAAVIDYGTFISLSERLSDTFDTVYYYSPFEAEFADVRDCCRATGLNKVKRLDDFMEPEIYDSIDLWIFPDVNYTGLQRFLRRDGKAVWGSMGASDLELYRTYFLDVLNEVGLPYVKSKTCHGLTALSEYLKQVKNKWVKINRYRQNMETWHHLDYDHSVRMLDSLAVVFGGQKEEVTFVVQDDIESDMEIGYDGWNVLGRFPSKSFQGYEKKNQLYLGSLLNAEELPEEVNYGTGDLAQRRMRPCSSGVGVVPATCDPCWNGRKTNIVSQREWEDCRRASCPIPKGNHYDPPLCTRRQARPGSSRPHDAAKAHTQNTSRQGVSHQVCPKVIPWNGRN